jgi:hypothetical protein
MENKYKETESMIFLRRSIETGRGSADTMVHKAM